MPVPMHGETPCGLGCSTCPGEPFRVNVAGEHTTLPSGMVHYVEESSKDYSLLYLISGAGAFFVPYSLMEVERRWKCAGFLRIHGTFLVPLSRIIGLKTTESGHGVVLAEGISDNELRNELPVHPLYLASLMDRLTQEQATGPGSAPPDRPGHKP